MSDASSAAEQWPHRLALHLHLPTAAAATMINSSPPSPAPPPTPIGPWGPYYSSRSRFFDLLIIVVAFVYFYCVALYLYHAERFRLRYFEHRRAAREAREPQAPSDAIGSASASSVVASVRAEAECAICLSELEPEGSERVRVLPACGHAYHDACVEAWLATRASCPTCRTSPRSRLSRTTRAP